MARAGGIVGRIQEAVEDRTGYTAVPREHVALLEASDTERRAMQKELDMMGWYVLDYMSGQPSELRAQERRRMAAQSRMVWVQDPVAGAAIDLTNEFVFGRGVPKPKAADEKVQEVIDDAWADPDNQLVLTSYAAQIALCTDLMLQSNLFILFFEGDDGKVKLGLLDHDSVEDAVRDSNNRLKVLYYVARKRQYGWDYALDRPSLKTAMDSMDPGRPRVFYYQSLQATDTETGEVLSDDQGPPPQKVGDGLVYHIAINRGAEAVFGMPSMRRIIKWMAALNDFMAARVDLTQAAAAFIMRRTVKGTPNQVAKIAAQAISRRSDLASTSIDDPGGAGALMAGPRPGSILTESDAVKTEPFAVNTQAGQATQDAQMIRSQIAAGTGWPQHYLGDQSNANLATASALELPVMKRVEHYQELFEQLFRTFIDRAIQKAVDAGTLPTDLTPEERAKLKADKPEEQVPGGAGDPSTPTILQIPQSDSSNGGPTAMQQAYEGQTDDEEDTERDLGYEFSMPNALKRAMADLITAVANVARTFDPNNTNLELSRVLLTIALGQGFDFPEVAAAVERILPEDYVDPAVQMAAQQAQAAAGAQPGQPGGPPPLVGQQPNFYGPNSTEMGPDGANPYGAAGQSTNYRDNQGQVQEAALAPGLARRLKSRNEALEELWTEDVTDVVGEMLSGVGSNGSH